MTLAKVCPKCGFLNDPSEMFCAGVDDAGEGCGFSVAMTEITMPGAPKVAKTESAQSADPIVTRRCMNGHTMAEEDAVCIECGADPETADEADSAISRETPETIIFADRYRVLRPLNVISGEADLFLCESIEADATDMPESVVIKHYRRGIVPSEDVQASLQTLESNHCLCPREIGEEHGRAFEVYEHVTEGTLADVPEDVSRRDEFLRAFVEQVASALRDIHQAQLLHRDLKPANVLLRSADPPHFILADFGASTFSEIDVHVTSTRQTTRYAAPETFAGITAAASDWWSFGVITLELLSGRAVFEEVDDRAFILSVIARSVSIPDTLSDEWKLLLKGLLTRDHMLRWGDQQVTAWLAGDDTLGHHFEDHDDAQLDGPSIVLGGQAYQDAGRYALAAAQADHWSEASSQMLDGELGTWLAEGKINDNALENWNTIQDDHTLSDDQRLMLGLLVLNDQLPLCFRGELITPRSFPATAQRSLSWLEDSAPTHLGRIGRELWLVDLSERRRKVKALVGKKRVSVDPSRLDALSLVTSSEHLRQQWKARQSDFPEPLHPSLAHLASRQSPSDADTVVLLAAPLDEFRSADDILDEAAEEAQHASLDEFWNVEVARDSLRCGRSEVFRRLSGQLTDFVRCGNQVADQWADTFRFDHRVSLARAIVLLSIPSQQWVKPEGGEHWRLLLDFFRRKVLSSVQRGPLLSLRIGKNAARIDIGELGSKALPAVDLLDGILSRETNPRRVDPGVLTNDALLQRRLRRLRNNSENYQRDTGISSLYLGFPFLVRRDRAARQTTPRFLPLLLWPAKLHYPDGQNSSLQIMADREQEGVRLNPAFGVSMSPDRSKAFKSFLTDIQNRDTITANEVIELLQPLFNREHDEVLHEYCKLPAEPRLPDSIDCRVIPTGVIFQCDFAGQELAEELDRLQQLPFTQSPAAALLRLSEPVGEDRQPPPSADKRYLVSSADPSQENAVYAARTPPGLLIQGPPGTGKSQTIVNIVADAVARGETVLVVCQKKAALEVVGHRLEAEGLGNRFAMIADPSRDRRPFLQDLRTELDNLSGQNDRASAAAVHRTKAAEVTRLEQEIDNVHQAMTAPVLTSGLTYEQIISQLIRLGKSKKHISLPLLRETVRDLHFGEVTATAKRIEHLAPLWIEARYESSVLQALKSFSPDEGAIAALKQELDAFIECENQRKSEIDSGKAFIEITQNDMSATASWLSKNEADLTSISESILKLMTAWVSLFESGIAEAETHRLEGIAAEANSSEPPAGELLLRTTLTDLDDDEIGQIHTDCKTAYQLRKSWYRKLWPPYYRSVRRIAEACNMTTEQVRSDIESLRLVFEFENASRARCRAFEQCKKSLRLESQVVNLAAKQLADKANRLLAILRSAQSLMDRGQSCPQKSAYFSMLNSGQAGNLTSFLKELRQGILLYELRERSLQQLAPLQPWMESSWIDQAEHAIRRGSPTTAWTDAIVSAWNCLRAFQTFRLRSTSIPTAEMSILAAMSEARSTWESVSVDQAAEVMGETLVRESLLGWKAYAEERSPGLLIERDEFENSVTWLRQACQELGDAVRSLVPRLPAPSEIARRNRWDDIVMFTGPRAKKLRETVDLGKDFGLYQLRPIWLANPDTVSRIFPLQESMFDVVVFDEASQLPVEYALPAIYRGKTIVVSGDEKQLPPTRFFAAAFEDDDDEETPDLEGDELQEEILSRANRREVKDCGDLLELASPVFSKVMLNVHYRSKYRQLIDFSNAAYYQSRLSVPVLHPLEKVSEFKPIRFVDVNGVYDNQTNEAEADRVVETLQDYWHMTPMDETPTIGVVTFNLKQSELIEDKLGALAEEDEEFCKSLQQQRNRTKDGERCGFFVKNVESVQGDERDCMIFSTTFGKNPSGTFRRNFGVLGQRGGERRLNVATTRAKERMVIFCSMPLEQISDTRQSLVAPQTPRDYLQAYLIYARAISEERFDEAEHILRGFGTPSNGKSECSDEVIPFVNEVRSFLEQQGWRVEIPPSSDAFRFDLAIRRADSDMFAIAISCDSPRHKDLRFARHRELWRNDVLRSTVPAIHRVWSRMWLMDSVAEQKRLNDAVNEAMR